jgi:hypothetical protein
MILSPLQIKILLHHHCTPAPFEPRTQVYWDAVNQFKADGVLKGDEERDEGTDLSFCTTNLGSAWVSAICNTPMPRIAYLDQNGKEIVP